MSNQASLFAEDTPANIREKASGEVRTAMGLHLRSHVFARLCRHPRFVEPARQILGTDQLYIQQAKINAKVAFSGEAWQWHYDFATHHREDGVPEPLALNLHVFLDDVTEHNGPLVFIPGSHRGGPVRTALDPARRFLPHAPGRLLRGHRQPARHRLAVRRQPLAARLPRARPRRGVARSLDADQHPQAARAGSATCTQIIVVNDVTPPVISASPLWPE